MLKDFINSYGLINETLVDIVEEGLTSDKISEALIKKLNDLNPSVKELFTQKNFEGKEKLSLNGLFKANLMKGN